MVMSVMFPEVSASVVKSEDGRRLELIHQMVGNLLLAGPGGARTCGRRRRGRVRGRVVRRRLHVEHSVGGGARVQAVAGVHHSTSVVGQARRRLGTRKTRSFDGGLLDRLAARRVAGSCAAELDHHPVDRPARIVLCLTLAVDAPRLVGERLEDR